MASVEDFANISYGFTHIRFEVEELILETPKVIKKSIPIALPKAEKSQPKKKKVTLENKGEILIKLPLTSTILPKIPLPAVEIVEKKNDVNVTSKIIDILKNIEIERVSTTRKGKNSKAAFYDLQDLKNFITKIRAIPDLDKFSDNKDIINHAEITKASKNKKDAVAFILKLHEAFIKTP